MHPVIKKLPPFAILLFATIFVSGQTTDTAKVKRESFNTYEELREKQKKAGADTLTYLDSTFNFSVRVPGWLELREAPPPGLLGGIILDGHNNAILVSGFPKSAFKSFDEFETIYLTGNKFGQPTKYNSSQIWYGQNELIKINHGVKQRAFTIWQNLIYYNMFVLLETKSAYLRIQFTASGDTYDASLPKFDEFMAGLKLTDY